MRKDGAPCAPKSMGLKYFALALLLLSPVGSAWAEDGVVAFDQSTAEAGGVTLGDTAATRP